MKYIGYAASFVVFSFLSAVWNGYVLSVLWAWFIISLFPSAPALGIASAIGISVTIGFLTQKDIPESDDKKSTTERIITAFLYGFMRPLFALIAGAIVRMFL